MLLLTGYSPRLFSSLHIKDASPVEKQASPPAPLALLCPAPPLFSIPTNFVLEEEGIEKAFHLTLFSSFGNSVPKRQVLK